MRRLTHIRPAVAMAAIGGAVLLSACNNSTGETDDATGSITPTTSAGTSAPAPETVTTTEVPTDTTSQEQATGSPGTAGQPPPAEVRACATDGLEVEILGQQGAAGSLIYNLGFTNASATGCVLSGFPGVSLVGFGDGTQLGQSATRDGAAGGEVALAPDATGYASLRISRAENYGADDCGLVAADGLRVYPPNETAAAYLPLEGVSGCTSPEAELLSIRAVSETPQ